MCKKTPFPSDVGGVFICIVLIAGCENFLGGEVLSEDLKDAITYLQAPSYEIRVQCEDACGSILTGNVFSKKVGDTFTVEFKASANTSFLGWGIKTKQSDGSYCELSSDTIAVSDYNMLSADGIYKDLLQYNQVIILETQGKYDEAFQMIAALHTQYPENTDMLREFTFLDSRINTDPQPVNPYSDALTDQEWEAIRKKLEGN